MSREVFVAEVDVLEEVFIELDDTLVDVLVEVIDVSVEVVDASVEVLELEAEPILIDTGSPRVSEVFDSGIKVKVISSSKLVGTSSAVEVVCPSIIPFAMIRTLDVSSEAV